MTVRRNAVLVSFVLMCLLVVPVGSVRAQEDREPNSRSAIYLGIWADPELDPQGHSSQERAIEARESAAPLGINRTFALHLHYYDWSELQGALEVGGVFHPDNDLLGDINHGRVPVISWKCDDTFFGSDGAIASGDASEDTVILQTARALAQYPGPVMLRWYWEFNVFHKNQNCRGDKREGFQSAQVYADFIGAWQHIRVLFHRAGADNVIFLWNPGTYKADGVAEDPHAFYPGNRYVDWIGVDTYQQTTETFAQDFDLFYSDFTERQYDHKPLMVGENGALPFEQTGVEQQWSYLLDLLSDVSGDRPDPGDKANRYPVLKAYCYFERGQAPENWVLDDNGHLRNGGLAAMKMLGASPSFAGKFPMFIGGGEGAGRGDK
jgi:hypothetical protein